MAIWVHTNCCDCGAIVYLSEQYTSYPVLPYVSFINFVSSVQSQLNLNHLVRCLPS